MADNGVRQLLPDLTPGSLDKEFQEFEGAHYSHKVKMTESWDFYMSRQWPAQLAQEIINRGQFPLVINKVYPAIQAMLSFLTAERPSYTFLPQGREDINLAWIHEEVGKWVWERSRAHSHFTRCILEMLVTGIGWMQVFVDPRWGTPRLRRIPAMDVFPDPSSQSILCDDGAGTYIRKVVTPRAAIKMWPEHAEEILKAPRMTRPVYSNSFKYQTETSAQQSGVGILTARGDYYRREDVPIQEEMIQILERHATTMVEALKVRHKGGQSYTIRKDRLGEFMEGVAEPRDWEVSFDFQVVQRQNAHIYGSDFFLEEAIYPTETPLLTPFMDNFMDNPMPEGEVEHLKGLSMERNKRRSLLIHHATTSSNSKWLVQDGSTPEKEFENKAGRPGAVLYWRRGYEKPEPVYPLPLPEVLHYLEQQSDRDIQEVSGSFGISQGDPKEAPQRWGSLLAMDEYGGRRPALKQRQMDDALSALGQSTLDLCQVTMTEEQVIRVVGADGRARQTLLNSGNGEQVWNDVSKGKWTVIVKGASTAPSNREARFMKALEMKREGIYDDIAVLKYMDDPEADQIIQRKSALAQAAQQNDAMGKKIEEMTGQLKNAEQMVLALQRQLSQEKATKEIDAKVAETRAQLKSIIAIAKGHEQLRARAADQMLRETMQDQRLQQQEQGLMLREAEAAQAEAVRESMAPQGQGNALVEGGAL
jgi:hypothetical protein